MRSSRQKIIKRLARGKRVSRWLQLSAEKRPVVGDWPASGSLLRKVEVKSVAPSPEEISAGEPTDLVIVVTKQVDKLKEAMLMQENPETQTLEAKALSSSIKLSEDKLSSEIGFLGTVLDIGTVLLYGKDDANQIFDLGFSFEISEKEPEYEADYTVLITQPLRIVFPQEWQGDYKIESEDKKLIFSLSSQQWSEGTLRFQGTILPKIGKWKLYWLTKGITKTVYVAPGLNTDSFSPFAIMRNSDDKIHVKFAQTLSASAISKVIASSGVPIYPTYSYDQSSSTLTVNGDSFTELGDYELSVLFSDNDDINSIFLGRIHVYDNHIARRIASVDAYTEDLSGYEITINMDTTSITPVFVDIYEYSIMWKNWDQIVQKNVESVEGGKIKISVDQILNLGKSVQFMVSDSENNQYWTSREYPPTVYNDPIILMSQIPDQTVRKLFYCPFRLSGKGQYMLNGFQVLSKTTGKEVGSCVDFIVRETNASASFIVWEKTDAYIFPRFSGRTSELDKDFYRINLSFSVGSLTSNSFEIDCPDSVSVDEDFYVGIQGPFVSQYELSVKITNESEEWEIPACDMYFNMSTEVGIEFVTRMRQAGAAKISMTYKTDPSIIKEKDLEVTAG